MLCKRPWSFIRPQSSDFHLMFEKNINKIKENIASKAALVFDFDGVIADSVEIKTWAFAELYRDYGEEVVEEVVTYHLNNGGVSRFDKFLFYQTKLLSLPIDTKTMETLNRKFSSLVINGVIGSPEIPGVEEFLNNCYVANKLSFINSATPTDEIKEIVSKRGMSKYFNNIYGSPVSKVSNLKDIISSYNLSPNEMVFFGDSLADYEAAETIGCDFVGVGKSFEKTIETLLPPIEKQHGFLRNFDNII